MTKKPQKSQFVVAAVLGAAAILLLGVVVGILIGKGLNRPQQTTEQAAVVAAAKSAPHLAVSKNRIEKVFAAKKNGAFDFQLTKGDQHDYFQGTSSEMDGVSLQLKGPPEELWQISVQCKLKNLDHRVQVEKVLDSLFKVVQSKVDVSGLMKWIDQSTQQNATPGVTFTKEVGRHRLLLTNSSDGGFVLQIEPALVVTWKEK